MYKYFTVYIWHVL